MVPGGLDEAGPGLNGSVFVLLGMTAHIPLPPGRASPLTLTLRPSKDANVRNRRGEWTADMAVSAPPREGLHWLPNEVDGVAADAKAPYRIARRPVESG